MLGVERARILLKQAGALLHKDSPTPMDLAEADAMAEQGWTILRYCTGLIRHGVFQAAIEPPPPGPELFEDTGHPVEIPNSEDPYIRKQRLSCAREILALLDENEIIPSIELQDNLSRSWDREKIVKPVLRRLVEVKTIHSSGNTRGAVYSRTVLDTD